MSNIKKHQCPSCGGTLTVDNDKQMYHCTFCGSTYDYEYFREEQMQEMGKRYLTRGEFMAAADAYRFMLKKDPHDFRALRGLMLAAARLRNMDEVIREKKSTEFSYDSKLAGEAIEGASEEDREYFTLFGRIYSDKKKVSDLNEEIDSLREDKRKVNDNITLNNEKIEAYYMADRYGVNHSPKYYFIAMWIFISIFVTVPLAIVILLVLNGEDISTLGITAMAVSLFVLTFGGINFALYFPKICRINKIEAQNVRLYAESAGITGKIRALGDEADKLSAGIRKSCYDLAKKDRQKMQQE